MLHAARHPLLFLCIATLITACGGSPGADRPTVTRPAPDPITVSATFDTDLTATVTVPPGGGTLSVTGGDGTGYVLVIPDGALLETAMLSMTPLSALSGAPVEGRAHAVLLEPAGLQLYRAATLTISTADGETSGAVGFAAGADGSEFHLLPPLATEADGSVSVAVPHFSQHGAFTGTEQAPAATMREPTTATSSSHRSGCRASRRTSRPWTGTCNCPTPCPPRPHTSFSEATAPPGWSPGTRALPPSRGRWSQAGLTDSDSRPTIVMTVNGGTPGAHLLVNRPAPGTR